jgi:hypothetical protein
MNEASSSGGITIIEEFVFFLQLLLRNSEYIELYRRRRGIHLRL